MADLAPAAPPAPAPGLLQRLAGSRAFQRWAARVPGVRRLARAEGEAIFDLVAGFCHSQVLAGLVELGLLDRLRRCPAGTDALALTAGAPAERVRVLLRAAAALGLVREGPGGWRLTVRGAALVAVPGLSEMIRHHRLLYDDLADAGRFWRDPGETRLAAFWPYVFGAGAADDPAQAERYSRLMADSQALVAEDTLATGALRGVRHLVDVGGGSGTLLVAAARAESALHGTLFDLPAVVPAARARFAAEGLSDRVSAEAGSFRDDPLPRGADAISLVRVLYDHRDETVRALLAAAFAALPEGGRLVVSEPMAGSRAGDAYYALYCLAMGTGRVRSADEIATLVEAAGFAPVRRPVARRPFITTVLWAVKRG